MECLSSETLIQITPDVLLCRFRLVSLELEALSKLRSETRIRDAMKELPKSLDKFYQRILGEIAEEDYNFAHNAFRWLAFALRPLYLNELAIAMAINTTDHSYQGESLDLAEVLDILPSGKYALHIVAIPAIILNISGGSTSEIV